MGSMPLLVAETDQAARQLADPYLNRYLEVWGSERWRSVQEALDAEIGEVTERLGNPS